MPQSERIELSDVTLHLTLAGEGPLVIAAHGFPDDASTFDRIVPALTGAGYRIAVPTMRGYAPSSVPRSGRYDLPALGADLIAIADRLSPSASVRLVGHDWGAAAAYAAAALAPDRIAAMAALAVPHPHVFLRGLRSPRQIARSAYMAFFQLRGLADQALAARDLALVDRLWRAWSPGYHPSRDEMDRVKAALRDRVGPALGYYRAMPSTLGNASLRRLILAPARVPVLRLHGADDGCVGAEIVREEARAHAARFEAHVIAGAGHFLQRERPDEVAEQIVTFFAS